VSKDELLSTLYNRHAAALSVVAMDGNQRVHVDAVLVSLALMARELADKLPDVHQANGGNGEKRVDLHTYEWLNGQIARINDWLEEHEPALYHEPDTDTGEAMIAAANRLRIRCANLEEDLDAARVAHASVCEQRDSLQVQLLQCDADNAKLTQEVHRLRSWTVEADARAAAAQPPPVVSAFVTASQEAEDYRIGLDAGRWTWREVPKRLRLELVRSVIAATPNHTQSEFDAVRPSWMATATAQCAAFSATWRELADLTHEIEVRA